MYFRILVCMASSTFWHIDISSMPWHIDYQCEKMHENINMQGSWIVPGNTSNESNRQ
jgi:hypothetical protein